MTFSPVPNLMLEALVFLGTLANDIAPASLEQRLHAKGVEDLTDFHAKLAPFAALRGRLEAAVSVDPEQLTRHFRDLPGFPYNTSGAYSPAFLLLFPMVEQYHDDPAAFAAAADALSPDEVARNLLISLDLSDNLGPDNEGCSNLLMDSVLGMNVPAESRLAILEIQRNYRSLFRQILACLNPVLDALYREQPALTALARQEYDEFQQYGPEESLQKTTSLTIYPQLTYVVRPLILSPDTNLFMDLPREDGMLFYCGALRLSLMQELEVCAGHTTQVYDSLRLLGDRTRFDLLCYLRTHIAYGQELSNHFGLARNTISHHISKLFNAGLITCTMEGNRVYYAVDEPRVRRLLQQLSALLLKDGTAEDPLSAEENR